jgi:hypothetical protein
MKPKDCNLYVVSVSSTLHNHVLFVYQNTNIIRLLQVLCAAMGKVLMIRIQIPYKVRKKNTLIEILTCCQIS